LVEWGVIENNRTKGVVTKMREWIANVAPFHLSLLGGGEGGKKIDFFPCFFYSYFQTIVQNVVYRSVTICLDVKQLVTSFMSIVFRVPFAVNNLPALLSIRLIQNHFVKLIIL
jgi:hypothetical protein